MLKYVWIIEDGVPTLYERKGECNRCGECCCNHTIKYQIYTGADRSDEEKEAGDWSEWEGWTAFLAQGMWWYIKVTDIDDDEKDTPCPLYSPEEGCTVWQDSIYFKPICRYWPFHPKDLEHYPNCGFILERVKEATTEEAYPE
jgi:hypothetical protein